MDCDIDNLVALLFDAGVADNQRASVGIVLDNAETTRDLFMFCLNLFVKVLTKAINSRCPEEEQGHGQWSPDNVSDDDLRVVSDKLSILGLVPVVTRETIDVIGVVGTNYDMLATAPPHLHISDYVFVAMDGLSGVVYRVWFKEPGYATRMLSQPCRAP